MDATRPTTPLPTPQLPPPADLARLATLTPLEQIMAVARASGPVFELPGQTPRTIVVSGFRYVDDLSDDARYDKALAAGLVALRDFAGDGLFTAYTEEPNWGKAHRILMPAFSQAAMAAYHPAMLDPATQLVMKWARLNPDETVDVAEEMTRLTLDTIGLCGFGYRFNSFYRSDLHPYVQAMVTSLDAATKLLTPAPAAPASSSSDNPAVQAARATMNAFVDEVIAARKRLDPNAPAPRDLLQFMLTGVDKATGEKLDDVTIRHEINTFLVAGHETTSGLLSFAMWFLGTHPEAAAKTRAEVDRVFGPDPAVAPTYDQVRALQYVPQVLKESLRVWPTAPGFARRPLQPDVLAGQYAIEPTDVIRIITPLLHRDPAVWGPDAERFDPDRWAPELEAARPANAYKPFGTGQRACIGRQFALQEAALVLAMVAHRFEWEPVAGYELKLRQTLTIKPEGLRLVVRPRPDRGAAVFAVPASAAALGAVDSATAAVAVTGVAASPGATIAAGPAVGAVTTTVTASPPGVAHDTPLLVLFGSNLGTAEDLAHRIANDAAARGFAPTVAPLDDYAGALSATGLLVVVSASYNGTPPDNAGRFVAWLTGAGAPVDEANGVSPGVADVTANGKAAGAADGALAGLSYAVFGCGNHEWTATYQAIPRRIDEGLAARGAHRLLPRGEGDAAADFDGQVAAWLPLLWEALAAVAGLSAEAVTATAGPLYTVERVSAPANPFLALDAIRPLTVVANRELQAAGSGRSTRHIEVQLPEGVTYQTGDHLGVVARNGVELVTRVLRRFGFAGDSYVRIKRHGAGTPTLPLDQPVPVIDLLSRYVDLQEVASRPGIATLAENTPCPPEKAALLALTDAARYAEEVLAPRVSLIDLLERSPSCELPFAAYLELLHPLRLRYYSIASSPAVDPRVCALTVAVVEAPARTGAGVYRGVASTYLARHPAGSIVDGYVRAPNLPFRPPADPATPIVMVGPGTGLAPFRGFLQDRAALLARGKALGPAMLFFGCRHPNQDFLYQDELAAFARHGIVELVTAFSRPDGGPKCYVQDKLRERAAAVWSLLDQGAIVYVCGDGGRMEPAVRQELIAIAAQGGLTGAAAEAWFERLTADGRYLADVWAQG